MVRSGGWSTAGRSCLAFALVLAACTHEHAQRDYLHRLAPAQVGVPASGPSPAARTATIVLFVDQDWRSRLRWREQLEDLVDRANAVITPAFGVRLRPSIENWQRTAPAEDLEGMLAELERLAATVPEAEWVAGFTGGLEIATANLHALGCARLGRPVFLLRAIDDSVEAKAFAKSFNLVDEGEVLAAVREHTRHKALVVFLHEWAHTLGAPHVNDSSSFLSAMYDRSQAYFGKDVARRVREGLAERRRDARAHVASAPATVAEGARPRDSVGSNSLPTTQSDLEAEVSAALARGDRAAAYERAMKARAQLEVQDASAASWTALARVCRRLNLPSCALAAAERAAPEVGDEIRRWAKRTMAVAGLTRVASSRFGISGPREPDYLEAYAKGEHDLRGSAWSAARDSIEEALRHFANVPALLALRCELAIRQEQRAAAHRDCGLALRSDPESAPVRVAAGLLVATDGELRVAEEHWRRALALAPDARQAWLNLGWLYRARRDRAKLERLGGEYRARFGEALPQ